MGILDHVQEFRIDIRLTLEIKDQVDQPTVQFIDHLAEKIFLHVAGLPGKRSQATRTFRATQVAGRGGLDGDGHRRAPLYGLAGEPG